ncbi:cache domain-containing protein [Ponticoccus sp. SC2-23]|uniref:cache domain-containing protein n=1 Tax=Alexandriicola marinus TaxID=2081710 RepID=UPI000FD9A3EA|nr:cache domain-containing protein [Alexandriicola marinus]MBM1219156.1 cache domain-containing protein [Ponticoccus sp. SC6-9]MBM1223772.1 cache domain-containing protein [Ponticoccus sp. SC6-15]MBM1228970.1 cache domain-containing protein [Ponticoccus sp. SC6-38]MBM1232738.1 cache domain-containing protein [Ponticoccus sp. SC6-45]MBM1237312.1 cache domain-containing protein [Ponticoccus sp. SC6-49]MBM1241749.1 cache domain-containing protein [Ponticoccus sp. SC2-64]MBM1246262.1 cache domai
MLTLWNRLQLGYAQKLFILAAVPMILAVAGITAVVAIQSRASAERELEQLETQLIEAKKRELRNYVTQARNAVFFLYGNARVDDIDRKDRVQRILSAMIYGDEGFFFVYDYDGKNIVSPRQTWLINTNQIDYTDSEGTPVVQEYIQTARTGSGYVEHLWPKPTTGEEARMISYVTIFPAWRWVVGTGVFIDDVVASVAASRAEVEARAQRTFLYIGVITFAALMMVFLPGLFLNIRERKLADAKLKALTQRVFDAQEEERGRVARELHDGISQILVGVKYTLDVTRRRVEQGDVRALESLQRGIDSLGIAIQEVRRISRDLRPGALDDLGLGPALQALADDFSNRTGINVTFETVVFRNRLDDEARIALYRIAQEALTNVERHAEATEVTMTLRGNRAGGVLRISDNGAGIDKTNSAKQPGRGLGLRNMAERVEQLDGTLRIFATGSGTVVEAQVPLSHMLKPDRPEAQKNRESA